MSDKPFVPFYTSDFLAGTSGMTAATKGVYITLLCLMYEKEEPIGQSWDMLARRCGCTLPAFKKAVECLQDDGKIEVNDGKIWSEKCEKHIALRCERRNSARSNAKKRWQKTEQKQRKSDANALRPQCKPKPEPYIDTNVSIIYLGGFDDFWQAYPRKVGEETASKAYTKAVRKTDHETIMAGLRAQLPKMNETEKQFIPHASTWLNQGRWQDEPEQLDNGNKSGQGGKRSGMVDALASVAERYRTGQG